MYWAGPIPGAVLAALIYDFIFSSNATKNKLKHFITDVNYSGDDLYEKKKFKDPCQPGDELENYGKKDCNYSDADDFKLWETFWHFIKIIKSLYWLWLVHVSDYEMMIKDFKVQGCKFMSLYWVENCENTDRNANGYLTFATKVFKK